MKCRYCGADAKAKTVATADDKLSVLVDCDKCGSYIDNSAAKVCNTCGKVLKKGVCKDCGIKYYAKGGLKTEPVKIATEEDISRVVADLMSALVMKDSDTVKKKLLDLVDIVPQVYDR